MGHGRKAFKLNRNNMKIQRSIQLERQIKEEYLKTGKINQELFKELNEVNNSIYKVNKLNSNLKEDNLLNPFNFILDSSKRVY